jgi:exonuclease VII large subunit
MSSPFAQKFMDKRPFSDEQYEAIAKRYKKKEKEQSADRGDAPDYETRMRLQKELAKELEQKKQEGSSSPNQMSPLNRYVSIEPAMQRLQRDAENIAAMDKKESTTGYDSSKSFGENLEASNKKSGLTSNFDTKSGKFDFGLDYKFGEASKDKKYGI